MIQIIDHGKWQLYRPEPLPAHAPPSALFVRRESDGVDWYDYVCDRTSFSPDTVKFTVLVNHGFAIGAATRDVTRLFPAGMLVRELTEYYGTDPQAELEAKRYDPVSNTLHDLPKPAQVPDLEARVAAIEARLGITP